MKSFRIPASSLNSGGFNPFNHRFLLGFSLLPSTTILFQKSLPIFPSCRIPKLPYLNRPRSNISSSSRDHLPCFNVFTVVFLALTLLAAQSAMFTWPELASLVQFGRVKRESWHRLDCRRQEGVVEGERSGELETVVRRGVRSLHINVIVLLISRHITTQLAILSCRSESSN